MPSPCVQVCRLDVERRHCLGCGRTIEEISRWSTMTAPERRAVLARLAARQSVGVPVVADTEGKPL
ncbi:DUF1289 domain-containing protein [Sphingosinicellaceae bacterium A1X5R2]|nr:DUF1289 domain-containing protein [Pedomonas mirosovicensis]